MSSKSVRPIAQISVSSGGTEQGRELREAVASSLAAWTLVELRLTEAFLAISHGKSFPLGAPLGFHAIISFEAKLKVVESVLLGSIDAKLPEHITLSEKWAKISNRCARQNKQRNKLAHGLTGTPPGGKKGDPTVWLPYFTLNGLAAIYDTTGSQHPKTRKLEGITTKDLRDREKTFVRLSNEIKEFSALVLAAPALRSGTLLPMLPEITDQGL